MEKEFVDELYHQLRVLHLTSDITKKEAISGIVSHLINPNSTVGDYTGLLRFLSWYGEAFLIEEVYKAINQCQLNFSRIVEFGAGFCWLGRGLGNMYKDVMIRFVDKRQWPFIDIVADIETKNGRQRVLDEMKSGDLIVMSELLHCLDDPSGTLLPFSRDWPVVAVEYSPGGYSTGNATSTSKAPAYRNSYEKQISTFNCKPVKDVAGCFPSSRIHKFNCFPYMIVIAEPL